MKPPAVPTIEFPPGKKPIPPTTPKPDEDDRVRHGDTSNGYF